MKSTVAILAMAMFVGDCTMASPSLAGAAAVIYLMQWITLHHPGCFLPSPARTDMDSSLCTSKDGNILFDNKLVVWSGWIDVMATAAQVDIRHEPGRAVGVARGRDGAACTSQPRDIVFSSQRVGANEAGHLPRLSQSAVHSADAGDDQHGDEDAFSADDRHGHVNCQRGI